MADLENDQTLCHSNPIPLQICQPKNDWTSTALCCDFVKSPHQSTDSGKIVVQKFKELNLTIKSCQLY